MIDTSQSYNDLLVEYQSKGIPISVSFRDLVSWIPYNSSRYTHQIHTYPAKVIPQIPYFFLNCKALLSSSATILDPFGGSGTVAIESCLAQHTAIVSDSNPLARLVTKVKTTPISPSQIARKTEETRRLIAKSRTSSPPDVVNIAYWYLPKTIRELARVSSVVSKMADSPYKRLCEVALSATARKVSLADPRISVPVRLNPRVYPPSHPLHKKSKEYLKWISNCNAIEVFFSVLENFSHQVSSLWAVKQRLGQLSKVYHNSLESDQNSLSLQPPSSVDAIITSPPYLGAQKYIRASSLSLGWLSMVTAENLRTLEDNSIGREHFSKHSYRTPPQQVHNTADILIEKVHKLNPLRAQIAATYLTEMKQVLSNCHRVLKKGGSFILVSGSNTLSGEVFNTTGYLREICTEMGFTCELEVTDTIKSRGLMTRRNRTASMIPLESVNVFRK